MLNIDISAVGAARVDALRPELAEAHKALAGGTGKGSDYTGWIRLPEAYDREEYARVKAAAERIRRDSQVLLVVGIGGSYLGARAVIEFLQGSFYNLRRKDTPDILFVGNNLSASYAAQILEIVGDRDFSVNVISKSGTTTEPAVAFRFWRAQCEKKYGREAARSRIYATTDAARGALKSLCDSEGYETFVIPDNIGGRYSVLTPVGLLPVAVAGVDTDLLMQGAQEMMERCLAPGKGNPAWAYAAARNALYRAGKTTEVLACYDPDFVYMAEWYKQLYGESEGKDGKGIFPASVSFTADLHSMGQYIQDGVRSLFETVVLIESPPGGQTVAHDPADMDGLNFLAGKTLAEIEHQAFRGTYLAHMDGGVPNLVVRMGGKDPRSLGQLIYFFEFACGLSGYLLGVNPFDQPGVEAYKKNMFALLGKPGFEEGRRLEERLKG